ncbi:hypothetical protein PPL_05862 [Heterostelium album PN500]|uniref:Uncharacterized protein n=1 Tax=Heterostelium pallidum (strain ATCC 26659 / Pp 5 / PN500) TaxID=670386 RepID=D3BBJ4_HETP5|nr:hypothetical protein PPL_05862 [Heterostelium album PN500]EFA81027.1 hypothetical protein PPL_05862 [Heterostelium album PN500]|eukprot:XP_020433145.1 hypothetical protein PPL_05862 [Heterostelium album PN500]
MFNSYKELITFGFLGSSLTQLIFDGVVLYLGHSTPRQDEDDVVLKSRLIKRRIAAYSIPVANVLGFSISYGWTKLLMSIYSKNPWLFGILMTLHGIQFFSPAFGYLFNIKAICRGGSRTRNGKGIMDEMMDNTVEAVFDYSRWSVVFACGVGSIPIYVLTFIKKV